MLCSHRTQLEYDWLVRTARISGERTVYFLDLANSLETKRNVISNRKRELDLHFCKINELPLLLINIM